MLWSLSVIKSVDSFYQESRVYVQILVLLFSASSQLLNLMKGLVMSWHSKSIKNITTCYNVQYRLDDQNRHDFNPIIPPALNFSICSLISDLHLNSLSNGGKSPMCLLLSSWFSTAPASCFLYINQLMTLYFSMVEFSHLIRGLV